MKRKDLVELFISRLATIRVANGYETDAGQDVKRIYDADAEPTRDSIVLISGREDMGTPTRDVKSVQRTMTFKISGVFVDIDGIADNAQRAESFSEDLMEFWATEETLGEDGVSIHLDWTDVFHDENGRLSEVVAEFTITH